MYSELLTKVKEFDLGTYDHSINVHSLTRSFCEETMWLPTGQRVKIADLLEKSGISYKKFLGAALLHDIGKTNIPANILFKPGKLDDAEKQIVSAHENHSRQILNAHGLTLEASLAGQHHNYGNFPYEVFFKIPQIDISIPAARIIQLADMEEALLSKRCYKQGISKFASLKIITEQANKDLIDTLTTCFWVKSELKKSWSFALRTGTTLKEEIKNFFSVLGFLTNKWNHLRETIPACPAS